MPAARRIKDHRTRVGAERRQRMHAHLLESALSVFAAQGIDASIDDVIAAAGVSRGTFYNYFQTNTELLAALADELAKELIQLVESTVASYETPIKRVGIGVRLFLHVAREHPQFAAFLWRAGFNTATAAIMLGEYLPKHIEAGIAAEQFTVENAQTGMIILAGIVLAGSYGLSNFRVTEDYVAELTRSLLLALGAARKDVEKVLALSLPALDLPPESLFAKRRKK